MRSSLRTARVAAITLAAAALPLAAPAQPPAPPAAQIAAIDRIGWLVGVWEGQSEFDRGPQGKSQTLSWERVRRVAGGTALMVEGRHHVRLPDGGRGARVHDAAAIISFDEKNGRYRFTSQLGTGVFGEHEGRLEGEAFVWSIATPRGPLRFRIERDAGGRWSERGEQCGSTPEQPCRPFFSMQLQRVGDAPD